MGRWRGGSYPWMRLLLPCRRRSLGMWEVERLAKLLRLLFMKYRIYSSGRVS